MSTQQPAAGDRSEAEIASKTILSIRGKQPLELVFVLKAATNAGRREKVCGLPGELGNGPAPVVVAALG